MTVADLPPPEPSKERHREQAAEALDRLDAKLRAAQAQIGSLVADVELLQALLRPPEAEDKPDEKPE